MNLAIALYFSVCARRQREKIEKEVIVGRDKIKLTCPIIKGMYDYSFISFEDGAVLLQGHCSDKDIFPLCRIGYPSLPIPLPVTNSVGWPTSKIYEVTKKEYPSGRKTFFIEVV